MLRDSLDRNVSDVRSAKLAKGWGEGEAQAGSGSEKSVRADQDKANSGGGRGNSNASTSTIPTARCGPASQVVWEGGNPPIPISCDDAIENWGMWVLSLFIFAILAGIFA